MILVTSPRTLRVMQGQLRFSEYPDDVLVGFLGSGIAACARDPVMRIGAMYHFRLGDGDPADPRAPADNERLRYTTRGIEKLIQALHRKGGNRARLEVSLFGGATGFGDQSGGAMDNTTFMKDLERAVGVELRGNEMSGRCGRRIRFHPYTGEVEVALMQGTPAGTAMDRQTATP